jgi:hypothetical protein
MSMDIKQLKARAEALFKPPRNDRHALGEYEAHLTEKTVRLRALRLAKEAARPKRSEESKDGEVKGR